MDFDLNDEQRQLKESVDRLLLDRYGDLNQRLGCMKQPEGYGAELWQQYADLGLLGIPFAEEDGGLGQGVTETMIVAEAFGRALAVEPTLRPYPGRRRLAPCRQRRLAGRAVPPVVEGNLTLALAHQERQARYDLAEPRRRRGPTAGVATRSRAKSASSWPAPAPIN